jgi:hypothetical protein
MELAGKVTELQERIEETKALKGQLFEKGNEIGKRLKDVI